MATDERNFRSYYYEKVGFRGVEEKKSLEILLKDKPLDVIKLKQFCLRFPVPALHRNKVWKILLGIKGSFCQTLSLVFDYKCRLLQRIRFFLSRGVVRVHRQSSMDLGSETNTI